MLFQTGVFFGSPGIYGVYILQLIRYEQYVMPGEVIKEVLW